MKEKKSEMKKYSPFSSFMIERTLKGLRKCTKNGDRLSLTGNLQATNSGVLKWLQPTNHNHKEQELASDWWKTCL